MKATVNIAILLAGVVAISLTEISLMFWLGGNDVSKFCDEIVPGLPTDRLAVLAKKHDVRLDLPVSSGDSGVYLTMAHTPRSFGRHICRVLHDKNAVLGSDYGYAGQGAKGN